MDGICSGSRRSFEDLVHFAHQGRVVPFVGAGASVEWRRLLPNGTGVGMPQWKELLERLFEAHDRPGASYDNFCQQEGLTDPKCSASLTKAAQYLRQEAFGNQRREMGKAVSSVLRDVIGSRGAPVPAAEFQGRPWETSYGRAILRPDSASRYPAIITTNYEDLLERGSPLCWDDQGYTANASAIPVFHRDEVPSFLSQLGSWPPPVMKIHGSWDRPELLALTDEDYRELHASESTRLLVQCVALQYHILFIGYSFQDPHFKEWLADLQRVMRDQRPSAVTANTVQHFIFMPEWELGTQERELELRECCLQPVCFKSFPAILEGLHFLSRPAAPRALPAAAPPDSAVGFVVDVSASMIKAIGDGRRIDDFHELWRKCMANGMGEFTDEPVWVFAIGFGFLTGLCAVGKQLFRRHFSLDVEPGDHCCEPRAAQIDFRYREPSKGSIASLLELPGRPEELRQPLRHLQQNHKEYEDHVRQLIDKRGGGSSPLMAALRQAKDNLEATQTNVLVVITDGAPSDLSNSRNLDEAITEISRLRQEIESMNCIVLCCYIGNRDLTDNPQRLLTTPGQGWDDPAKLLFHLASEVDLDLMTDMSVFPWLQTQPGSRAFIHGNNLELCRKLLGALRGRTVQ